MKIEEIINKIADENEMELIEISADSDKEIKNENKMFTMSLEGENGEWKAYAQCIEESNLLIFYVSSGIVVPKNKMIQVKQKLMELNYPIQMGAFYIEPNNNIIISRISQYIFGTKEQQVAQVENIMKVCGLIIDNYIKEIYNLLRR